MQRSIRRVSIIVILAMTSLSLVILPAQATTTWSLAVAGDGAVYAANSGGTVCAFSASDGQPLWNWPCGATVNSLVADNDRVYVGTVDGHIYALNAATGVQAWTKTFGTASIYLTVDVGRLAVVYSLGSWTITMLDPTTGDYLKLSNGQNWNRALNGLHDAVALTDTHVVASLATQAFAYLLTDPSGAKWFSSSLSTTATVGSPVIAENQFYITFTNRVESYPALGFSRKWSFSAFSTGAAPNLPAVANTVAYVSTVGGSANQLYALNANTGALIWSYGSGVFGSQGVTAPVLGGSAPYDMVYVGSASTVYAVKAGSTAGVSGSPIWTFTAPEAATPRCYRDGVVYATSGGYLYALNAETGSQIWVAPADSPFVLPEYPLGALLAIAVPLLVVVCCRAGLKGKQRF